MVILVEEGCIEVELGGESHVIEAGDSIHFDASLTHRWVAGRGKPARLLTLAMMPKHLQTDLTSRTTAVADAELSEVSEIAARVEVPIEGREAS